MDGAKISSGKGRGLERRAYEQLEPRQGIGSSKTRESIDVAVPPPGEHHADGRDIVLRQSAPSEHHLYQCASGPAVAVGKGVQSLELGVHESCLHEGSETVVIDRAAQIVQQYRVLTGRRGDEIRAKRTPVVAPDPVARVADPAPDTFAV